MRDGKVGKIYLAGPITDLSYETSISWRDYAVEHLKPLIGVSPLRAKYYLAGEKRIKDSYEDIALSSSNGITTRDRFDVMNCDIVLANVLGANKVSIGTIMEIAWADAFRKPIILITDEANIHNHAMLKTCAGFIVNDLDSGINIARAILLLN